MNLNNLVFKTTEEERIKITQITDKMHAEKINSGLISIFSYISDYDQGMYDTMLLWFNETDPKEKLELIKDLFQGCFYYLDYLSQNDSGER